MQAHTHTHVVTMDTDTHTEARTNTTVHFVNVANVPSLSSERGAGDFSNRGRVQKKNHFC